MKQALIRSTLLASYLGVMGLVAATPAQAFTINLSQWYPAIFDPGGANARDYLAPNHELITLCALDRAMGGAGPCSLSNYTTLTPLQGALVAAVAQPNYDDFLNPNVNETAPHHFDDFQIQQGVAYVQEQWDKVKDAMGLLVNPGGGVPVKTKSPANTVVEVATRVIQELGKLIHAQQDFYAHSNYVEIQTLVLQVAPGLWDHSTLVYHAVGVSGISNVSVALGSGQYPGTIHGSSVIPGFGGGVVKPASAIAMLPAIANFKFNASGVLSGSAVGTSHDQMNKDDATSKAGKLKLLSGESLFEIARELAILQTQNDLNTFLNTVVGDPVSGADLLDIWTNDPEFLSVIQGFLDTFDPSNPQSWAQFNDLGAVAFAAPEPGTAPLSTLGLLLLLWFYFRSARSSRAARARPSA